MWSALKTNFLENQMNQDSTLINKSSHTEGEILVVKER